MTWTRLPDGTAVHICDRGNKPRARACAFCGTSTKDYHLCDFPLRGKRKNATCSKPICVACAVKIGDNRDLCPPHAKMAREHGLDVAILAEVNGAAGNLVALDQLEANGAPMTPRARNKAVKPPVRFQQRTTHDGKIISAVADWEEYLTERAAIGEYLGGLERAAAEQQARELAGARPK